MANPIQGSVFTKSGSKKSGFTLVEVVVAIAVALVVVLAVYFSIYHGSRSMSRTMTKTMRKQELMRIFHRMRRQLINLYEKEEGENLVGEEGIQERQSELYFLTTSPDRYQGVGEVGYRIIKDEDGDTYLAYTEFPYPRMDVRFALNNPQDKWQEFSRLVKELKVEYESGNQWSNEWKRKELPDRVRITLYYEDEDNEDGDMEEFSFIVVPGIKSLF
jgi:prepilin-type N-terminal cleavage/methylation domain-containing protein